jgi:N-acetylglucosamine-6-sulfatase
MKVVLSTLALFLVLIFASPAISSPTVLAQSPTPLLYTTLDDIASVSNPVNGTGAGSSIVTTPANDFVPGHIGNGINIDAAAEYVRFVQISGATKNIELSKGTIDFWYEPNYNKNDGVSHRIFGFGTRNGKGSFGLYKRTAGFGNDLYVVFIDSQSKNHETTIVPGSFNWSAGQWVNLRITWDSTAGAGIQNTRIYMNGQEMQYQSISTGSFPMPAENSSAYIYIGSVAVNESKTASGILDEVEIYENVYPPSPAPTNTPVPPPTDTPLPTATDTLVPTATDTPLPTETNTSIPPTWTNTPLPTDTPVPAATDTPSPTDTPLPTATHIATATNTPLPTATDTATATNTPLPTATDTATATNTPLPTATDTATATNTPLPTATDTATATNTPLPTATDTATATNTPSPNATATSTPSSTPTATPTATATPIGDVTLGLVGYWKMDESSWNGTANEVQDSSGNLKHGTARNGAQVTTGKFGNGGSFDGVNDAVVLNAALDASVYGTNARSIAVWFKANSFDTGTGDILFNLANGGTGQYLSLGAEDNGVSAIFNGNRLIFDKNNLSTGVWYHFVLVIPANARSNQVIGYINGVSKTPVTEAGSAVTINSTITIPTIGADVGAAAGSFDGTLDELRVYNRALSASEVTQLFNFVPSVTTPTPTSTPAITPTPTSSPPPDDTTPPQVSITYPLSNSTISNNVTLKANAADNVAVAGVQFKIDGVNFGAEDVSGPYAIPLNALTLSDGSHLLEAVARDSAGNTATATTPFNVNNSSRPNIVFIMTDDQRFDTMQYMPLTNALLGPNSIKFSNAFDSTPLCCPSRASILTGKFAHNTGIYFTSAPNGGAVSFDDSSTIALWLEDSGYKTGIYGKYLNGYNVISPYIPPGWTEWHVFVKDSSPEPYYNYELNENGVINSFGSNPQDYSTDVLASKAVQFINNTPANQPFFLYVVPFAPHYPYTPAPSDIGTFSDFPNWRPPSYNEADVSDKPTWVQQLPLLTPPDSAQGDANHRMQLESLQAVDRMVQGIYNALQATGRLNNTYIVFTSDNGLSWGEHRHLDDKICVYEECAKVPLWIQGPGISARADASLVENIDYAPTFAQLAGVVMPNSVNGLSMAALLTNPQAPWRNEILLEGWGHHGGLTYLHGFQAVRTSRYVYGEYYNGDREFYDLVTDPYQMNNAINNPNYASIILQLESVLATLRNQ